MNDGINVKIHMFEFLKLGGAHCWNWSQHDVAGPYWRLYWNSVGGAFVKVNRREVELGPDKIVMLAPDTVYSTRTEQEVGHLYLHFSLDRPLAEVPPQMFEILSPALGEQGRRLAQELEVRRNNWKTMLQMEVLIYSSMLALPEYVAPIRHYDPRIAQAMAVIETRHDLVSNRELARAAGMSVNGFLQLFREEVGEPPQTYSRRKRLNDASKLLHFSDTGIDEIAADTGFCDRYHLSRVFKREFGVGPAEFRRQVKPLRQASGDILQLSRRVSEP